jgi:retinol dehydrogenase 12
MTQKGIPFDPAKDIPSLEGKIILITSGSLGLGKQTAPDLAKHNLSELWIAARGKETGNAAVSEIKKSCPGVSIHFLHLELASFTSVKEAAQTFSASISRRVSFT